MNSSDAEEVISKAIVKSIKDRFNSFDTPAKFDLFTAEVETHPMEDPRSGRDCPRIDIKIEGAAIKPRPQFTFEAKRLKKGSHGIGDYTGEAGLGCFLRCQYAENFPSAGMLAYIQDENSLPHWKSELERKFRENQSLDLRKPLQELQVLLDLPNEWFSEHARSKESKEHPAIGIFHIFLDCWSL
ncbi:MAG: hypothetical protein EOP41_02835 [Sphingobacteriaceae bacterium]|nr:MAG: hypothetical protein EOP41_02835 [Sphingobacteriaceae bacterium]